MMLEFDEWLANLRRPRYVLQSAGTVLIPSLILGSLIFLVVVGTTAQSLELFRVMLEPEELNWAEIAYAGVAAATLSALLFFWYRALLDSGLENCPIDVSPGWRRAGRIASYLVAATPWAAGFLAVRGMGAQLETAKEAFGAALDLAPEAAAADATLARELMANIAGRVDGASVVIAAAGAIVVGVLAALSFDRMTWLRAWIATVLLVVALALCLVLAVYAAVANDTLFQLHQALGPLAAGVLMAISLFAILLIVGLFANLLGMPGFLGVLGLALVYWGATLLAGHGGATVAADMRRDAQAQAFDQAADAWLEARAAAEGAETPMIVASAQGGGIYAAIASSVALTRLHESLRAPNAANGESSAFHEHLFAISAVSGGSIGSSFYHALAEGQAAGAPCGRTDGADRPLEEILPELALAPYLAPIIGNIPADVFRKFRDLAAPGKDRSDALIDTLEGVCPALAEPYRDAATRPALVLNTTWMSNGHRVGFAPFSMQAMGDGTLWSFDDVYGKAPAHHRGEPFDPSLAQAAATSARFPGALPPLSLTARFKDGVRVRHNYGDGGYADASGATTALEIYDRIKTIAARRGNALRPRLLLLTFDYAPVTPETANGTPFADVYGPMSAIIGVRGSQTNKAITRAQKSLRARGAEDEMVRISVAPDAYGIALGWRLSRTSYEMLAVLIGRAEWCDDAAAAYAGEETTDRVILTNSCAARRMVDALRP